ncbi:type 1 glutamine amidotransferase domain-containing protein [Hyalangium minutum]|uniref:ThiJ/PfpI family protein n=1 Tax=Hyalangium minutum TaxID=394096 RepID=A0A085VZE3_9BACT|nr:type 1 glutamine amidotransferase domain-containing protein [Hyalangium minutum]KFE60806.1 ThiJ/PfpI family protein [Hyalangium minutum]
MARIMFIVASDFEDSEFRVPFDQVKQAGHEAVIVSSKAGKQLKGKKGKETITSEKAAAEVSADDFDALVIPGGYSPDHLRMDEDVVNLVQEFSSQDKPIAAICHAGWMLAEADIADGRTVTSWPSIKKDLMNAGANWVDREVVEDGNLITSRKPDDLPAFCKALLRQIDEGIAPRIGKAAGMEAERPSMH